MVRAGHALYGYVSPARGDAPPQLLDVKPALTWKAKLLAVKDIPEGALVGYGGTFRAPRPMRIGILGAGYADGIFHRLSNRGKVIADGKLTAILGTISMDLTTIDLSHTTALAPGDEVTLLGAEGEARLDAQQIARVAGTISYNILCSISARVRRVYVSIRRLWYRMVQNVLGSCGIWHGECVIPVISWEADELTVAKTCN